MEIDYKTLENFADSVFYDFELMLYKIPMQDLFKIKAIIDQTIKRLDKENDTNEL